MSTSNDSLNIRDVLGCFATGVTVVTAKHGDDLHGMTCNAFCSVTLEPPTVMVSLTRNSRTAALIEKSGAFAVNILGSDQSHISDRFAGRHEDKEEDRFEGIAWSVGTTGSPILTELLAHLECRMVKEYDGGDHALYLGEIVGTGMDESKKPLLFFRSGYRRLAE